MNVLTRKIPAYYYNKSNLIRLVLFTAFFDLIFINIYKPFSSLTWYPVSEFKFFIFSSLVILTGVLAVAISRVIMYFYTKKHTLNYLEYGIWIVLEIFFLSTFYTVYSCFLRPERDVMETFWEASENTSLILLLPYAILMLYFSWRDKEQKLHKLFRSGFRRTRRIIRRIRLCSRRKYPHLYLPRRGTSKLSRIPFLRERNG